MPVLPCNCKNDSRGNDNAAKFQDKEYGAGRRLHTTKVNEKHTCTVCGATK